MKQKDMRSLTHDQKDAVHIRVVEAFRRQGYSVLEASKIFGVARQSVYNWLNRYESGGKKTLKCRKAPGSEKKTSRSEEAKVIHRMRTGKPEDYGLVGQLFSLWKRKEFPKIAKEALKAKASLFLQMRHRYEATLIQAGHGLQRGKHL